jgi:glycosyltransferase involved in cell wall biosynthesis
MSEFMPQNQFVRLSSEPFLALGCGVLIPTYNNGGTLESVIRGVLEYTDRIILINDGSTDNTSEVLALFPGIKILTHAKNLGKGMALRNGFQLARQAGYRYMITIDSDGQHFPSDFPVFLEKILQEPDSLIIGARNMRVENVPGKSTFGNNFSNFWFLLETGIRLPDTQSGFRLYPVERMKHLHFFTRRFEFEIEVIVEAAWNRIPVTSVPVNVYYAKGDERISHFRPGRDFTRISFLNTWLVTRAILWYRPLRLLRSLNPAQIRSFLQKCFQDPAESPLKKAVAVGVGVFFGIIPIWGFQLAAAIFTAIFFKLNKAIVALSANISVPPMIPLILYGSLKTGELVTGKTVTIEFKGLNMGLLKANAYNFYVYIIGATVLSVVAAILSGLLTYLLLNLSGRKRTSAARS